MCCDEYCARDVLFVSVADDFTVAGAAVAANATIQQQCKLGSSALRAGRRHGEWEHGTYQQCWVCDVQSTLWSSSW